MLEPIRLATLRKRNPLLGEQAIGLRVGGEAANARSFFRFAKLGVTPTLAAIKF